MQKLLEEVERVAVLEDPECDSLAVGRPVLAEDLLAEPVEQFALDLRVGREEVMDDLVARDRGRAVAAEAFEGRRLAGADPPGDRDRERARQASVGVGLLGVGLVGRFGVLGFGLDLSLGLELGLRDRLDVGFRDRLEVGFRDLRVVRDLDGRSGRERLLGELQVGRRVHGLGPVGTRYGHIPLLDALQREGEATALAVDLEDPHVDGVALRDDLARVLDVMRRELRDVDEPFDSREDLDEGAEGDHLRDAPFDDVVLAVRVEDLLPWVGLGLLPAERDPLAVAVDVEHLDLDGLADVEHLGRVVHVAPAELGDVDQPVHAVEVDEGAEVDDVRDLTFDHVAGAQAVEDRLPHLLALVLEDGAAREDDVVARAVELDDLAAELLAEELVEILDASDVHERGRKESAYAEVEDETALDDLDDLAGDRLAGLRGTLDALPCELEARALLREDEPPFGVLLGEHERVDLLADRDLVGGVDRPTNGELGDGDDALRLVADVDENLVLVDAHDRAVDDLALVYLREGSVVVGDELPVGARRPDTLFGGSVLFGDVVRHRIAEYSRMQRKSRSSLARAA